MKLSGWFLRIGLILMIALSLVFSWLIWQNPSRLGHQQAPVAVARKTDPDTAKNLATVMAPSTAYYQHDNAKQFLFTPDANVLTDLRQTMKSWRIQSLTAGGKLTASEYNALLTSDDTLQLVYADSMAYSVFNGAFFTHKHKATSFAFTRLLVNLGGNKNTLVFVNDKTRAIHTATLQSHKLDALQQTINAALTTSFAAKELRLADGRQVTDFTEAVALQPYVYLLDQQSANHYVSLLMPASATNNVDARELGSDTVYTAGTDYRLTMNQDTQVMQFDNTAASNGATTLAANLKASYQALGKLDLQGMNSMRYDRYTPGSRTVSYRSLAQGLPIFNSDYYGRVTVADTDSGQQMFFSTNNLTVPIPTSVAKTTLPTTQAVLARLLAVGYRQSDIQDLTLGYHWAKQDENSQVVNLTPTYYVEIGGRYQRYTKWQGPAADKAAEASSVAAAHEQ